MASGPGLWLEELEGLDREGLLEQLLGGGTIGEAVPRRRTATSWTGC